MCSPLKLDLEVIEMDRIRCVRRRKRGHRDAMAACGDVGGERYIGAGRGDRVLGTTVDGYADRPVNQRPRGYQGEGSCVCGRRSEFRAYAANPAGGRCTG